ncbi:CesT family type III secretion system chaperone [Pseudomonas gingeri]|uniref:CesT family type III secretion system chaperone n=1 Tax=Pseudomonas gingeri TaxID=117681 RepID=A0A7Y7YKL9_9PSED|nr:CesT family type III secretion system chaperone [Pseudomonas gingeri]NWA04490.1 CesT family type III secretion system chaperone [Pseudomonas gingeri]NWA17299.1 CesT family type III secretion system chaperone [Pseudomonas gingeri]NWA56321.1 CesT family type III secretion system chaperone [Pseudomonas gingeri]NWA98117.1 CesT family type III secretion system chaperone [Pseudomonas gingeri]NWB02515.1 CesT family type III secretion system chaperone [Pseudomonas gingeri]
MASQLKQVLSPVFHRMDIDEQALEVSDSYVMTLPSGLVLEWREAPNDFLTVSCLLPVSEQRFDDPQTLGILLQSNLLGLEHPPILTGAIVEQKKVILWTRQPFLMLDHNAMQRLFERFTEQADKLGNWLALTLEELKAREQASRQPAQKTPLRGAIPRG